MGSGQPDAVAVSARCVQGGQAPGRIRKRSEFPSATDGAGRGRIGGMPAAIGSRMSEGGTSTASARGAVQRALLVGINDYPRHPLRGCINDVEAVREFLERERGFSSADIAVLINEQATRAAIVNELRRQAAASRGGDGLVFYFCGHGAQLPTRDPREADGLDEVLCPVDFAWTAETAIIDDELEQIFDSVAEDVALTWVFDACHTGDIDEQLDARVAGFRGMGAEASGVMGAVGAVAVEATAAPGSSVRRPRRHGVILSACAATEKAADIFVDNRPHGAFTHHLLAAARQAPRASAGQLLAAVREALAKIGQHPEGYGPGLEATFISTRESNVKPREQTRTVLIAQRPSVDADRHLHVYLAEASRMALVDDAFGTRMSQLGLDLSGISAGDATVLARAVKPAPRSGGVVCRTFWWGFHLEISNAELETMNAAGISRDVLGQRIEMVPRRVVPHLGTLVDFVVASFENIKKIDRGAGVFVSMSSFAPDLYVTTAVPVRHVPVRRTNENETIRAIGM